MKPTNKGEGAVDGLIARLSTQPDVSAEETLESGPKGWSNNWADWDNDGHNNWVNANPTPPPGGK